ncbi:uncharacterized protein LOC125657197 isoform X4 [Ostrea edulis]|uniref:uncharacterized protein LOC125657197 isoform X4 n=1 Tax=Ostrea edulis TaxID=37623 RepID=UPI0024AEF0BB|nr:uncharacterized protein LOC125657197 isoform X4 [Ostrea edulis]
MNIQAQDAMRCSTCDNVVSISCRSCRLDFCNDCIGDHVTESLSQHDVVPYEDKFTREVILPECDSHRDKNCTLVCKVCDVPICSTCFTKNHLKHQVEDLVEAVKQKRSEVQTDLRNISEFISHYGDIGSDIEKKVDKVGKNCDVLKAQIGSVGLILQNRMQQKLDWGKEKIDNYGKNTEKLFLSFESNVNSRVSLLLDKKKEKEMLLQNNVALQIMDYSSESYFTEIPPSLEIDEVKLEIEETGENALLGNIVNDIPINTLGSNVVLEAVEDFEGHRERDMCFNKRDLLMVDHKTFNNTNDTHVVGIHLINGKFGYIPKSHVAIRRLRGRCNQLQRWWTPIGRERTKEIFLNDKIQNSTFCISDYTEHSYNLSIKCDAGVANVPLSKMENIVSVEGSTDAFTSLPSLVHFYQEEREGFPCQLSTPLHHQMPTAPFEGLKVDRDRINIISEIPLERLPQFDMFEGRSNINNKTTIRVYQLLETADNTTPSTIDANNVIEDAENMREFSHENILQFVALSAASYPMAMITEFVRQTLLQYLKTEQHWQHISIQTIVGFAAQISNGMDYCHRKKFFHMNLRAENVFMDEHSVLKIGGLHAAKRADVEPFQIPQKTRMRTQWASPESLLDNTFSRHSDVWSFGILLYEMVTFGGLPFSGKTDADICALYGMKIGFPHPTDCYLKCPDSYYNIMESCCKYEATSRSSFDKLMDIFKNHFISQLKIANRVHHISDGHGVPQLQIWWTTKGKDNVSNILMKKDVKRGAFFISEATEFIGGEIGCLLSDPGRDSASKIAYDGVELARNSIESLQLLGTDDLNDTYRGVNRNGEKVTVFTFNEIPNAKRWSEDSFIEAANILNGLSHENILGIIGCCSTSKPVFMVTEPVRWILHHILKLDMGQSLKLFDLVEIATQIANGMKYLSSKSYIHRDLRTMNILLTQTFEVKVGGLNLCTDINNSSIETAIWSIRWCAPEIFQNDRGCLLKSDVWSFGILLYELITFGMKPYGKMSNHDVQEEVQKGYIIPRPSDGPIKCPEHFYKIMTTCWKAKPEERLGFELLHKLLKNYFK